MRGPYTLNPTTVAMAFAPAVALAVVMATASVASAVVVPSGRGGDTAETYHVLVGMVADSAFSVSVDGELLYPHPERSNSAGILEFTVDGSGLSDGTHTVSVGNTLGFSGIGLSAVGTSWAVIEWTTSRPSRGWAEYGLTDEYGTSTVPDTAEAFQHSARIEGLTENTSYHFRVCAIDADDALVTSSDFVFSTLDVEPTGPPSIGGLEATSESAASVVIRWTTDRPAVSYVRYGIGAVRDTCTAASTVPREEHEFVIEPIVPSREYTFVAVSACGADTACSSPGSFVAVLPPGQTSEERPAALVRWGVEHVGEATAHIVWATDRPSTGWIEYGPGATFGLSAQCEGDSECVHSATLTGLVPGMEYAYRVYAADAVNGAVRYESGSFSTASDPPASPSGLEIDSTDGGVVLVWEPNGEPDLLGYNVYRIRSSRFESAHPFGPPPIQRLNAAPLSEEFFLDQCAETSCTCTYAVSAVDTLGQEGDLCDNVSIWHVVARDELSFSIHPNPSFGEATLAFTAAAGPRVTLRIYSVGGRLVRELTAAVDGSPDGALTWDGRDAVDRPVGSGVYLCELACGGETTRGKLAVLR